MNNALRLFMQRALSLSLALPQSLSSLRCALKMRTVLVSSMLLLVFLTKLPIDAAVFGVSFHIVPIRCLCASGNRQAASSDSVVCDAFA